MKIQLDSDARLYLENLAQKLSYTNKVYAVMKVQQDDGIILMWNSLQSILSMVVISPFRSHKIQCVIVITPHCGAEWCSAEFRMIEK